MSYAAHNTKEVLDMLTIINAIAVVSIVTGVIFFIVCYYGFTHVDENMDEIDEIKTMIEAIMASQSTLLHAMSKWAVFPPLLMAGMAIITAFIISRKEE